MTEFDSKLEILKQQIREMNTSGLKARLEHIDKEVLHRAQPQSAGVPWEQSKEAVLLLVEIIEADLDRRGVK